MAWSCAADRALAPQARHPPAEPNAHAADCSRIRARSRTPARSDEKWPAGLAPLQSGLLVAFRETHGEHVIGCSREERRPTRACTYVGGELDHCRSSVLLRCDVT